MPAEALHLWFRLYMTDSWMWIVELWRACGIWRCKLDIRFKASVLRRLLVALFAGSNLFFVLWACKLQVPRLKHNCGLDFRGAVAQTAQQKARLLSFIIRICDTMSRLNLLSMYMCGFCQTPKLRKLHPAQVEAKRQESCSQIASRSGRMTYLSLTG